MNKHLRDALVNYVSDLMDDLKQHVVAGRKIGAIKTLREHTGFSLRDAKDIVESEDGSKRRSLIDDAIGGLLANPTTAPPDPVFVTGFDKVGRRFLYEARSREEAQRVYRFAEQAFDAFGLRCLKDA